MLKRLLRIYPLFLVLLPVFILTHIEREYRGLINYSFVYIEIIFLLCLPVLAYGLGWLITRSGRKAGLMAVLILVIYYFFGEVKDAFRINWPGSIFQSYSFLFIVFSIILVAAAIFIRRSKSRFEKTYLFINTVLLFFVIFDLSVILFSGNDKKSQEVLSWSSTSKPDIYYLIFDSYTSSNFLKQEFVFDNSEIDSALIKKGFHIITHSQSNYNLTPFSIGSVFNLDFVREGDSTQDYYLRKYLPGVRRVKENVLFPALQKAGYTIYNHSIFDVAGHPTTVPSFDIWHVNQIFQQHNLIQKMDRDIGWNFPNWLRFHPYTINDYARNRDRHDSTTLQQLYQTINSPGPKFVYSHFFIPHSPYTFDSAGNKIEPIGIMPLNEDMKAYTRQIVHVNRVMNKLVDSILGAAKGPLAIIIQGDHGFRFGDPAKKQWEFNNFNAFYFSDGDYHLLNDSLSNVNTFRVLANKYFNQQYPLLPGNRYFLQYK